MGLGAMLVLLVVSVVILPKIVQYLNGVETHYMISGFQDMQQNGVLQRDDEVAGVPAIGSASKLPTWRPDSNTDYLCRSPNESGSPCPEGTFCDGTTQSCIPMYVGGPVPSEGYFS